VVIKQVFLDDRFAEEVRIGAARARCPAGRPATAPENGNRAIAVRFAVANRF